MGKSAEGKGNLKSEKMRVESRIGIRGRDMTCWINDWGCDYVRIEKNENENGCGREEWK